MYAVTNPIVCINIYYIHVCSVSNPLYSATDGHLLFISLFKLVSNHLLFYQGFQTPGFNPFVIDIPVI